MSCSPWSCSYRVTHLLCPNAQTNLLVFVIEHEDAVLDFVAPKQFITLEILDPVVSGDELTDSGLSDVPQVLLGIFPGFGLSSLE